jgi:hypothetical protein
MAGTEDERSGGAAAGDDGEGGDWTAWLRSRLERVAAPAPPPTPRRRLPLLPPRPPRAHDPERSRLAPNGRHRPARRPRVATTRPPYLRAPGPWPA